MSRRSDSSSGDSSTSEKDENHIVQKKSTIVNVVVIVILISLIVSGLIFLLRISPYYYNIFEKESDVTKELAVNSVRPDHYFLSLTVYLPGYGPTKKSPSFLRKSKDFIFEGKVKIDLRVLEPTDTIKLHSLGLKISKVELNQDRKFYARLNSHKKDESNETLILSFNRTLEIDYISRLRDDLSGFYKAVYKEAGLQKTMAVTHFEPMSARKMVPCFDEPTAKAKWTIVVTHPVGTVALSNMMEITTTPVKKELQRTRFKTTPKMSSYLLAITVAAFKKREAKSKRGVLFRVWAKPDDYANTELALKTGIRVNNEFENYFGIKFPLEKQDMIAVPEFSSGAMENWGLITFKETALLLPTNSTSVMGKNRVMNTIAHELAHQWVGNLVTMKWWDDLWLNEGFATYFEHFSNRKKKINMDDSFIYTQDIVLNPDARAISHPLVRKVETSQDAHNAFNTLIYNKGASLIWMIKNIMGERKFQAALKTYLKKHAYGNVNHTDLFNALDEQHSIRPDGKKFDVMRFGRMWSTQVGFPLLTVNRGSPTSVMIRQERYRNDPDMPQNPDYANPEDKFKWDVPIWYQVGTSRKTRFTMLPAGKSLKVLSRNLIVLNIDAKGFYRVNYDEDTWKEIIKTLKSNLSAYSDRTVQRLVSDIFVLAAGGRVDYQTVIDLIESVDLKPPLVNNAVYENLQILEGYYGKEPEGKIIQRYRSKLFKEDVNVRREMNFLKETFVEKLEDDDFTELGTRMIEFNPILRGFGAEVIKDGEEEFDRITKKLLIEKVPEKKLELVKLLASSKDLTLLRRIIPIIIDTENQILRKDVPSLFGELCSNEVYQKIMVSELLERWNELHEYMKTTEKDLNTVIAYSFAKVDDKATMRKLKQFMKEHPETFKFSAFSSAIENGQFQLRWKEKFFKPVAKLFEEAYKKYL